jgi:hypothetical protein
MIRKLSSGEYRLYSRKIDPHQAATQSGDFQLARRARKHERAVQYFKRH